jgi:membrane protein
VQPEAGERIRVWPFVRRLAERALSEYVDDNCPHFAASISYRVLFSIFPLVIVLTAVFGIVLRVAGIRRSVVDTIVGAIPLTESGQEELRRWLEGATGSLSTLGLVGIVGLLWAASGMMAAIRTSLNSAWDVSDTRPFLQGKLLDLLLVLSVGLAVTLSVGATIAVRFLDRYASDALAEVGLGSSAFTWLLSLVPPLALSFAVTVFLYSTVPATRPRVREVWPAALFVAVVFTLIQNLFALYLEHFTSYNRVYGALGAIIAFLFFTYVASSVFLLGAEVASAWPRVRRELERGEEKPGGPPFTEQLKSFFLGLAVRRAGRADEQESKPQEQHHGGERG